MLYGVKHTTFNYGHDGRVAHAGTLFACYLPATAGDEGELIDRYTDEKWVMQSL